MDTLTRRIAETTLFVMQAMSTGGELLAETEEGNVTQFTVNLPFMFNQPPE